MSFIMIASSKYIMYSDHTLYSSLNSPIITCLTLSELFPAFVPRFLHLQTRANTRSCMASRIKGQGEFEVTREISRHRKCFQKYSVHVNHYC